MLEHPPYSPDLAPYDCCLFPKIKLGLKDRHLSNENELLAAWDQAYADILKVEWEQIFKDSFLRMEECMKHGGEYSEKLLKTNEYLKTFVVAYILL